MGNAIYFQLSDLQGQKVREEITSLVLRVLTCRTGSCALKITLCKICPKKQKQVKSHNYCRWIAPWQSVNIAHKKSALLDIELCTTTRIRWLDEPGKDSSQAKQGKTFRKGSGPICFSSIWITAVCNTQSQQTIVSLHIQSNLTHGLFILMHSSPHQRP
jgi:hypothetical protein